MKINIDELIKIKEITFGSCKITINEEGTVLELEQVSKTLKDTLKEITNVHTNTQPSFVEHINGDSFKKICEKAEEISRQRRKTHEYYIDAKYNPYLKTKTHVI